MLGLAVTALAGFATVAPTVAPSDALPPTEHGPARAEITGRGGDGLALGGHFRPTHFGLGSEGHLAVTGAAWGALSQPGALQRAVDQQITLPVDWGQTTATCQMLNLAVGPADLPIGGPTVHVDQTILNVSKPQGPGSRLGVPLCAIGNLLKQHPISEPQLAGVLNEILRLLGQGG